MRDYALIRSHLLRDLEPWLKDDPFIVSDDSLRNVMARALADSFYKKLCPLGNTKEADEAALKKFKSINERIPDEPFGFTADSEAEACFWDYFKNNLNQCLGWSAGLKNYDLEFIRETMNIGPGSAQKANPDNIVTKLFEGEMSYYNDDLIPYYRSALAGTGLWAEAESLRFQRFRFTRVAGGKIFFAPKNAEISRTCCTEANMEMLFQKSLGAFFEYRLEKVFGIRLDTQPDYNRELARRGSIDGSKGTIDKVSASDSIIKSMLFCALEDGFTKAMIKMCRAERAVLPDGSEVVLKMISTMGNGFTFPLQTVIFASAVRSCYQLMGKPCSCPRTQYGVFGDDVVVDRDVYAFYCRMITKLGFEVNAGKSFNSGPFRESCGHDYYNGTNVRGVYVRSLETPQQIYSCINRLIRWSTVSGITLTSTVAYLRTLVRDDRVPFSESDDAGIKVPFTLSRPSVTNNYWFRYRFHKKVARKRLVPEPDDSLNPYGTAVGWLSGHIRRRDIPINTGNGDENWGSFRGPSDFSSRPVEVPLRDPPGGRSRYRVSYNSIPWWDYPGAPERGFRVDRQGTASYTSRGGDPAMYDAWKSAILAYF